MRKPIESDLSGLRARYMAQWIGDGKIKYREHLAEGLENAPEAFRALLRGRHLGKMLVKVGEVG